MIDENPILGPELRVCYVARELGLLVCVVGRTWMEYFGPVCYTGLGGIALDKTFILFGKGTEAGHMIQKDYKRLLLAVSRMRLMF